MVEIDASTPQLKVIKKLGGGYCSLAVANVEPLLSKNYHLESLPESTDFPEETKESHLKTWGEIISTLTKHDAVFHEVIDAPGKVVIHLTLVSSTIFGTTLNYETIYTFTFVEEDGELKILRCKDFANPQQRSAYFAGTLKAAAERAAA